MKDKIIRKINVDEINKKMINNKIKVELIEINENESIIKILKEGLIDRVFIIKAIASSQINILEDNEIIENGLFIHNLGKWIFNIYNKINYLYKFVGGKYNGKILSIKEIEKISIGKTKNMDEIRINGGFTQQKELDEQPIVKDYLGPMFERIDYGIIYLRYETQEVYNALSH